LPLQIAIPGELEIWILDYFGQRKIVSLSFLLAFLISFYIYYFFFILVVQGLEFRALCLPSRHSSLILDTVRNIGPCCDLISDMCSKVNEQVKIYFCRRMYTSNRSQASKHTRWKYRLSFYPNTGLPLALMRELGLTKVGVWGRA
jgi:hypothetical protein